MPDRLRFFILSLLLTAYSQLGICQNLSLGLPTFANLQPGDVITVPVTTFLGFDSIESMQFVIKWDSTVLRFVSTQDYKLPQLTASNFGYLPSNASLLRVAYAPSIPNNAGVTMQNGSVLFSFKLRVVGAVNSGSPIQISEDIPLTYFEIIKTDGTVFTLFNTQIKNGFAPVGYTSVATHPEELDSGVMVFPNPATHHIWVRVPVEEPTPTTISLLRSDGHLISKENALLHASEPYHISVSDTHANSICFLLIQSQYWSIFRPVMIFNE